MDVRQLMIDALLSKYKAQVDDATAKIVVYLHNPVGIGEHPDVLGAIQDQIDMIAKEQERLDVLKKYFED